MTFFLSMACNNNVFVINGLHLIPLGAVKEETEQCALAH
jgi:hypothetical protein